MSSVMARGSINVHGARLMMMATADDVGRRRRMDRRFFRSAYLFLRARVNFPSRPAATEQRPST